MLLKKHIYGKVTGSQIATLPEKKSHVRYFLIKLCTLFEHLRPQREKEQLHNLMFLMLLKVYYFSFLVFGACTFNSKADLGLLQYPRWSVL